ncbi:hemin uptake protein HemP [Amylibacter sp. IMCC11727]|uniref:hemin uptake protein HemP n=1 Tax=Amylibacter sp. IMCC11727 TaxID=3039851 RepID=UPI00244DEBB7|nr:hemin uptake protein HemP [Amylibacter sp. IMCC11727]WGI21643.1 hemin uptake protein HemP [Amylibacter sp. IMCC11727]
MTYQTAQQVFEGSQSVDGQGPVYLAKHLTDDGNLAQIAHNGQIYTLRITRNGKLILTK